MNSEVNTLWQALGLFCQEKAQARIAFNQIAHKLKMPEQYVFTFHAAYKDIITNRCK